MKVTGYKQAVSEIQQELRDSRRMYDQICYDKRRKIDQPREALHYLDGKRTGLELALKLLERVKEIKF